MKPARQTNLFLMPEPVPPPIVKEYLDKITAWVMHYADLEDDDIFKVKPNSCPDPSCPCGETLVTFHFDNGGHALARIPLDVHMIHPEHVLEALREAEVPLKPIKQRKALAL